MNYVFLSPHFPPNFKYIVLALKRAGIRVLGIGGHPYDLLDQDLKEGLAEYYYLEDMDHYEGLLRALGHFIFKYGRIHWIESHNEYWLEKEARLRTDFNVPGRKEEAMASIKRKSEMKKVYEKAGIPVAPGILVRDEEEVRRFVEKVGYPLVVKPDIGVGAADTYKLEDQADLEAFFQNLPDQDYLMEAYIEGEIHTFDGLVDQEGDLLFVNSFVFGDGVMETVSEGLDQFYYSQREIPDDLRELGMKTLQAFEVRGRFFHFEFFRTNRGDLVALEVNIRPPGGLSLDMFNYANDIDVYDRYARMVAGLPLDPLPSSAYYCGYVGIKYRHAFSHSMDQIQKEHGSKIVHQGPVPEIFSAALGDYAFIIRSEKLEDLVDASQYILSQVS